MQAPAAAGKIAVGLARKGQASGHALVRRPAEAAKLAPPRSREPPMVPSTDRELCKLVNHAAEAIGTAAFAPRLLDLLAAQLPFDRKMIMRYAHLRQPVIAQPYRVPQRCIDAYFRDFSEVDPFLAAWRSRPGLQLATLQGIDRRELVDLSYLARFTRLAGLTDELAIYLPAGDEAVALFLERTQGHYSEREQRRAAALYPTLLALHESHRRLRHGGGGVPGQPARAAFAQRLARLHALSRRELQVLELLLAGLPRVAIADSLGISEGTAKNHRKSLYRKLRVGSEREILALALEQAEAG
jgi:DNA-binding CsgD family transcriptional regulator